MNVISIIAYFQCQVDIREIREVRKDNNSKDFRNFPDEFKKVETDQTFVILYGGEFNLKSLSLAGECVYVTVLYCGCLLKFEFIPCCCCCF